MKPTTIKKNEKITHTGHFSTSEIEMFYLYIMDSHQQQKTFCFRISPTGIIMYSNL